MYALATFNRNNISVEPCVHYTTHTQCTICTYSCEMVVRKYNNNNNSDAIASTHTRKTHGTEYAGPIHTSRLNEAIFSKEDRKLKRKRNSNDYDTTTARYMPQSRRAKAKAKANLDINIRYHTHKASTSLSSHTNPTTTSLNSSGSTQPTSGNYKNNIYRQNI